MPEPQGSQRDPQALANACTRFLSGRKPRTVRDQLLEAAENPLALQKSDHYGRGGVVTDLENHLASEMAKEAAVFMPSGTMAQQIALRIWSDRAACNRVAFHPLCHLQIHEQMGYEKLHGLEGVLLGEADRLFTVRDLRSVDGQISTLLIELPQREIGGQLPTWSELVEVCNEARTRGIRVHLDGARFFECITYYDRGVAEIMSLFDSAYLSFYKIIGGLPGAALLGPANFIQEARIWQRRMGGNLYTQAASALTAQVGLKTTLPKLASYVAKASEIAAVLGEFDQIRVVPPHPPTNMMHVFFEGDLGKLTEAALQIAEEDKVGLFFALPASGKLEVSVADGALDLSGSELRRLLIKLFELAAVAG